MEAKKLLCVDDETSVLQSLSRLLRHQDYEVLTASSAEEALEMLRTHYVQVVMVDQRMPDMGGIKLLQIIKEKYPDIVRTVLSGFADVATILEAINNGEVYRYLGKPWNDEEIKVTLRQCFEHYFLKQSNVQLMKKVEAQCEDLMNLNSRLGKKLKDKRSSFDRAHVFFNHMPSSSICIDNDLNVVFSSHAVEQVLKRHVNSGDQLSQYMSEQSIVAFRKALKSREAVLVEDACLGALAFRPVVEESDVVGAVIRIEDR